MGELTVERRKGLEPKRPNGRPTKYNEVLAEAICERLRNGATRTAAAEASGLHRDTFRHWCEGYSAFFNAVLEAEAEAEIMFTQTLADAANGDKGMQRDWRAAETWLKRRRRADYGDTLDIRKVDAETLLQLLKAQQGEASSEPIALEDGEEAL